MALAFSSSLGAHCRQIRPVRRTSIYASQIAAPSPCALPSLRPLCFNSSNSQYGRALEAPRFPNELRPTRVATLSPPQAKGGGTDEPPEEDADDKSKPEDEGEEHGPGLALEKTVLIQAFGWDSCDKGGWYKKLLAELPKLKGKGITHMWLPPPSQSVSNQGYLPGQLYNLTSKYGPKEDLIALIEGLKEIGIIAVADVVINHRCAQAQDDQGLWNTFTDDVTHKGERVDWGKWAITGNDPDFGGTGAADTGEDYGPAPDLDHSNPKLRDALKDWLRFLAEEICFGGWRFDFVKGYAAEYVVEYITETLPKGAFCVAEYWVDVAWNGSNLEMNQDGARQLLCNFLDKVPVCCAFDFPMKGILQEAVKNVEYYRLSDSNGKPPGLIGWWPQRAVTFVDNHDTGSTQKHWPHPESHIDLGYAYIFTHPGMPCIFWDHYMDPKLREKIDTLNQIRTRAGIDAGSEIKILRAEHDLYVAVIGGKVTIKLGPRFDMGDLFPKESDGWKTALSGLDYCVWEKE